MHLNMVAANHVQFPATLPTAPDQLSVLSYNVLLPNSQDGWWNYKMYDPSSYSPIDIDRISTWEYRRKLLKDKIQLINPDVVCMQEVSPISFEEDFSFMGQELGYDGVEMFKRGRFRPATFWKTQKCRLAAQPVHKDRTLLTAFHLNLPSDHIHGDRIWHVLNCHLQAGPQGPRRVRQIDEGINASFKLAKKLKEDEPRDPLLIVCGDFNGGDECGANHYLLKGEVGPSFVEDGLPVSSREKRSPLSEPLIDASSILSRPEPPTLVVAELISQMVQDATQAYEEPELSDIVLEKLGKCYKKYATHESDITNEKVMNVSDVERWLIAINKKVGRGTEFRNAAREMGWVEPKRDDDNDGGKPESKPEIELPQDGILSLEGFINVYRGELRGGKFWGISYDLSMMGEPLPSIGLFEARFDRMYTTTKLHPVTVIDTTSKTPCPNQDEPSDHLPVAATFKIV